MKILIGLSLASFAYALRPTTTIRFGPEKGAFSGPHLTSETYGHVSGGRHMLTMCASQKKAESGGCPFSRRNLLKSSTKAAGVLGAGIFLQQGFVAGVPYYGKPDLSGKTAVVTGGNTGLGKETAVRLAQLGADVTIACRSPEKTFSALEDIKAQAPGAKVQAMALDLASLSSVESFTKRYASYTDRLDMLVNNAGVMAIPDRETTEDGFEMQFGTNHLGHFRLTSGLMPSLLRSQDGRVVNLSSIAHMVSPGLDNLNAEGAGAYNPWSAYALSKLCNVLFTKGLQRRLDERGESSVTCSAVHPGVCRTELGRHQFDPNGIVFGLLLPRSPREGAQTQIACAAEPSLGKGSRVGGGYFVAPKITAKASNVASDPAAAELLWTESERMVGRFFA